MILSRTAILLALLANCHLTLLPAAITVSRLGGYDTPGDARGLRVLGDTAFIADGNSGLQIVSVANPANPGFQGSCATGADARDVDVAGAFAYVADGLSGLQIINVSNLSSPFRAGGYDSDGEAGGIQVTGSLAVMADYGPGTQIIDISNPSTPVRRGVYDNTGYANGIRVVGNRAFVAKGATVSRAYVGFDILDISNPSSPSRVGGITEINYGSSPVGMGVDVSGDLVFLAGGNAGLQIFNVADPSNPSLVGFYDTPGWASSVRVQGSYAFLADGDAGMQMIDVSNPAFPVRVGGYDTTGSANDLEVNDDLVYLADGAAGLVILRVSGIPPSIIAQPVSQSPSEGGDVVLTVAASGHAPLTYQWQRDGINLSDGARIFGATSNVLTVVGVQPQDSGGYSVLVSNPGGTVSSQLAEVWVIPTDAEIWSSSLVLGPNHAPHDCAGIYSYTDLVIADNTEVTSSNISHLVIKVTGTLKLGSNVVMRVRNGFYPGAPAVPLSAINANNLGQYGLDVGGIYVFTNAFGRGGDGGGGYMGGRIVSLYDYIGGHGGGGGGGFGGGQPGPGAWGSAGGASSGQAGGPNGGLGGFGGWGMLGPSFNLAPGGAGGWGGGDSRLGHSGETGHVASPEGLPISVGGGGGGGGGNGGNGGGGGNGVNADGGNGGGGGGYGGGVLTIIAERILYEPSAPPRFLVSGQKGGSPNGGNGEGGLLIIQSPSYAASTAHWNLNSGTYGTNTYSDNWSGSITNDPALTNGGHGVIVGNPQQVIILTTPIFPEITSEPQSLTLAVGSNAVFTVGATGNPPLNYRWYFNGTNLAAPNNPILTLTNLQLDQAGDYQVIVTNTAGAAPSQVATLTLFIAPPLFLGLPQSQSVHAGTDVTFSVLVGGSPPLSYQWRCDGTNLPGATNSALVLAHAQPADSGDYTVVVTNWAGSLTSAPPASLTVSTTWLDLPESPGNGPFHFTLQSPAALRFEIETSTNLVNWANLATLTNVTGTFLFSDPTTRLSRRFYRARQLP